MSDPVDHCLGWQGICVEPTDGNARALKEKAGFNGHKSPGSRAEKRALLDHGRLVFRQEPTLSDTPNSWQRDLVFVTG